MAQNQIFTDDLVVESGQVYESDINVYSGDVTVEAGGLIRGSLYVYSGNVEIEEGGEVQGDVAAFSGDVTIAGQVNGNLAVLSGDIELDDSAVVNGDLSVMSGKIDRATGARINGNVARGPNLRIPVPEIFGAPAAPEAPATPESPFVPRPQQAGRNMIGSLIGFILRMIGAALFTGVVGVLAWLLYRVRPDIVRNVRIAAEEQLALSFAVGAIVNVGLLFLTMLLIFTGCLAPVGFITGLLAFGPEHCGLVGYVVVGGRTLEHLYQDIGATGSTPDIGCAGDRRLGQFSLGFGLLDYLYFLDWPLGLVTWRRRFTCTLATPWHVGRWQPYRRRSGTNGQRANGNNCGNASTGSSRDYFNHFDPGQRNGHCA